MSTPPKRPNEFLQEPYILRYEHVANANGGTVTTKLDKLTRRMKVTRVKYINPTGLAEHSTNVGIISIKNGATVVATWRTDADDMVADASIPANTFMDLTLATDTADRVFEIDDVLSLVVDEEGTTTVPAGRVVVEGVYF